MKARALALDCDDPRRMAFLANGMDHFARHLLGSLPNASTHFTPLEWTTAVALHLGTPVPALKGLVGETIRNNPNSPFTSVDPHGHNLTTIAGVMGGGTQRNHNAIARAISNDLRASGIKHKGGATDTTCKTVFRSAIPRSADIPNDAEKHINSMIPDLVIFTKHIPSDVSPLGGADHLIDVKTLAAGQAYKSNTSHDFGKAVSKRQEQVNTDYHSTARRLDARLHKTQPDERGPFMRTLYEYGGKEGRVLGPVVGIFGESSSDLNSLRDLCANELASRHTELFRISKDQASSLFRHQLNRKWGHTIARGWARLILDRLRDYVGANFSEHQRERNEDYHEQYSYFNPPETAFD